MVPPSITTPAIAITIKRIVNFSPSSRGNKDLTHDIEQPRKNSLIIISLVPNGLTASDLSTRCQLEISVLQHENSTDAKQIQCT